MTGSLKFEKIPTGGEIQVTVRRGALDLAPLLCVLNTEGNFRNVANILFSKALRLADIQPCDLLFSHDPACRTIDGLGAALRRYYPGITADPRIADLTDTAQGRVTQGGERMQGAG